MASGRIDRRSHVRPLIVWSSTTNVTNNISSVDTVNVRRGF